MFGGSIYAAYILSLTYDSIKMAMAKSIEVGSIVTGSIMLFFAAIIVICGAVVAHKLTGEATAWIGLWSLYVSCEQSQTTVNSRAQTRTFKSTLLNWSYVCDLHQVIMY